MKLTITLLLLIPMLVFAQKMDLSNSSISYQDVEQSYLMGLNSDNLGLKVSCAYFLGEIKSQKSVIPLMRMLRSAQTQEERLIAALSLIKIGDARGIYLVKKRSENCQCDRTKRLCKNLYYAYHHLKYEDVSNYVNEGDTQLVELVAEIEKN